MENAGQQTPGNRTRGRRLARLSETSLRINESLDVGTALRAVMDVFLEPANIVGFESASHPYGGRDVEVAVRVNQDFHIRADGLAHRGDGIRSERRACGRNLTLHVAAMALPHLRHEGGRS